MKIKIEKFWDNKIKNIVNDINDSLKRMEIEPVHEKLNDIFDLISSNADSKMRVSLCFVLEKIAQYEPFYNKIINFFIDLLKNEKNSHVKEFSVYILGNLVLNNPNLALITRTLPIFVKFCEDSSEYVRASAEDIRSRLNSVKESKIKEKEIIQLLLDDLSDFIDEKLEDMNIRANNIVKDALSLDYEAAFNTQEMMVKKIHLFSDQNQKAESEIKSFISKQKSENPIYEGEFKEVYARWKEKRAEKENLIRQIHCVIRIQARIFKIIQYIKTKGKSERISIDELKEQTKGSLRGVWSDEEIIETLEKLVEEEIVPTFFLQQLKDIKGYLEIKKKNKIE
ncbi:MAG: hypothetical protein ACTSQJ_02830 [Promethearchaeota archaeon]